MSAKRCATRNSIRATIFSSLYRPTFKCKQKKTLLFYRTIVSTQDCKQPQHDLHVHRLAQWETTWEMALHPDKCNMLRLTRRKRPVSHNYSLKSHQLNEGPHKPNNKEGKMYAHGLEHYTPWSSSSIQPHQTHSNIAYSQGQPRHGTLYQLL